MGKSNYNFQDLTGQIFTRLTVLRQGESHNWNRRWFCQCICGRTVFIKTRDLKSGNTKSCGCLLKDILTKRNKSAGMIAINATLNSLGKTSEYHIWHKMIRRCHNPISKDFPRYGGRGITVCERWRDFRLFLEDMGLRPASKMQIDRIDNNKGYMPDNCRWVTPKEQANNRRNSLYLTFLGETRTISGWAENIGLPYHLLFSRAKKGWPIEKILSSHRYNRRLTTKFMD